MSRRAEKLSKRGIDPKDSDAKAKINLARVTGADKADSRKKHVLTERSNRLAQDLAQTPIIDEVKLGLFLCGDSASAPDFFLRRERRTPHLKLIFPEIAISPGEHVATPVRTELVSRHL